MGNVSSLQNLPSRKLAWRGRSGRTYLATPMSVREFMLNNEQLHMVAEGQHVLWVGSARDVIEDAISRARLRLALGSADRAYLVGPAGDEAERLTTIWDLEGAELAAGAVAA
jgi:hypothetical protein